MGDPVSILALDCATLTGWAHGGPGVTVTWGTYQAPETGSDIGRYLAEYRGWILHKLANLSVPVTHVVFEAPIIPRGKRGELKTNLMTLRKLCCLAGVVELVCYEAGVDCSEVYQQKVRAAVCARGWAGRGVDRKAAVMQAVSWRGWSVSDDNEADACAILIYGALRLGMPVPWSGTPLEVLARRKSA